MDRVLHFVLAIVVVAILALLVSHNRKQIRIRYVIQLLVIEVLLAWFFLNSDVGLGFRERLFRDVRETSRFRQRRHQLRIR